MFICRNQTILKCFLSFSVTEFVGFFSILLGFGHFPQNSYGFTCYECSYTPHPLFCFALPGCSDSCVDPVKNDVPTRTCVKGLSGVSCFKMYLNTAEFGEVLIRNCTPSSITPPPGKINCDTIRNRKMPLSQALTPERRSDQLFSNGTQLLMDANGKSTKQLIPTEVTVTYGRYCTCDSRANCNDEMGLQVKTNAGAIDFVKLSSIHIGIAIAMLIYGL